MPALPIPVAIAIALNQALGAFLAVGGAGQTDHANAVRAHWGIENRSHWVMDVVFHDDLMRLRTRTAR